jgi:molybdate transport system substrate-binding protein
MARIGRACLKLALGAAAFGTLLAASLNRPVRAEDGPITVFAAASLKEALDAVAVKWQADTGNNATISYAGSSALAKQIEEGAPADVFVSADLAWMDYLAERKLIKEETRTNLLGNELVLIAPEDSTTGAEIAAAFDLAGLLGDGRLAIADPAAVPAGKYGKAALESLGVWSAVEGKLAPTENVRAALELVARGESPLGIVYATDAKAEPGVRVVDVFPESTHPPIVYPVAVTAASANANAGAFVDYLRTDAAASVFAKMGFTILD